MYQPMLYLHWKQIRFALIPFIVAGFALPLLSVQGIGVPAGVNAGVNDAYRIISANEFWLAFYPLLAGSIGITLALSAWNWDHQLKHVYALSLPITRLEYSMLKMGAGAALAMLPVAGLFVGAQVASMSVDLPTGLNAYPMELTFRFAFATLISYALLFAMASGTVKTTGIIMTAAFAVLVANGPISSVLANFYPMFENVSLVEWIGRLAVDAPGPFEVFTGNWTLIDV